MTLKSSSSNTLENMPVSGPETGAKPGNLIWAMTKKTLRRYIWLPLLALLGFVLALPVVAALFMNAYANFDYWVDMELSAAEVFEIRSGYCADLQVLWQCLCMGIIILGGLLAAIVLFRYLHVRTQVDFYHSLPVRREEYFWSNLLTAALMFLIPYLAANLVNLLVMAIGGWLPFMDMGRYLAFMVFNLLGFLTMFACGTLAMQLAGSGPGALKILIMSFCMCPLLLATYSALGEMFYESYVALYGTLDNLLLRASAPVFLCWVSALPGISPADWATVIILPAALLGASLYLYKHRRSETAGSTVAFGWQKPIFKYPLVLCGGILCGLFFYAISNGGSIWLYFGGALGASFMAILMDIFIKSEFKAIKKAWPSALVSTALVFVVLAGYQGDWLGYDRYLPEAGELAAVYVDSDLMGDFGVQGDYYYYDEGYLDYWDFSKDAYTADRNMKKLSQAESVAAMRQLVADCWEYADNVAKNGYYGGYQYLDVVWELQSGRTVARRYCLPSVVFSQPGRLSAIMNGEDYKQSFFAPGMDFDKLDVYQVEYYKWNDAAGTTPAVRFASEEAEKRFFETVQREYSQLSGEDIFYALPVCELTLVSYESKNGIDDYVNPRYRRCYLHPAMTESISMLNEACGGLLSYYDVSNLVEIRELRRQGISAAEAAMLAGQPEAAAVQEQLALEQAEELAKYPETTAAPDRYWDYTEAAVYRPGNPEDLAKIKEILTGCVAENSLWRSNFWYSNMYDTYYEVHFRSIEGYNESEEPIWGESIVSYYPQPTPAMLTDYNTRQMLEEN